MNQTQAPEYRDHPRPVTDKAATLSPNEARQAVELGTMRYVLAISTLVTIVVLAVAYYLVR
jgi:hypothetical protein